MSTIASTNDRGRAARVASLPVGTVQRPVDRAAVERAAGTLLEALGADNLTTFPNDHDRIPYFFSDQFEIGMEYSGYATEWDQVAFRGERESGEFIAFWLKDARVVAGMNVNVWDVNEYVQALISSRSTVDLAALCDPDIPLDSLVDSPARR